MGAATGLSFPDQREDVGCKPGAVLSRMTKQQLDQPTFASSEMAVDPPTSKAMQKGHRLLSEEFFEFVGRHIVAFNCRHSAVT